MFTDHVTPTPKPLSTEQCVQAALALGSDYAIFLKSTLRERETLAARIASLEEAGMGCDTTNQMKDLLASADVLQQAEARVEQLTADIAVQAPHRAYAACGELINLLSRAIPVTNRNNQGSQTNLKMMRIQLNHVQAGDTRTALNELVELSDTYVKNMNASLTELSKRHTTVARHFAGQTPAAAYA